MPKTTRRHRSTTWLSVAGALVVIALLGLLLAAYVGSQRDVTFTVQDKERVCKGATDGNSSCTYLLFTDKGTFAVKDTLVFRRWNSSDVYGRVHRGHRYDAHVVGWRLPFFSQYPNVLRLTEDIETETAP